MCEFLIILHIVSLSVGLFFITTLCYAPHVTEPHKRKNYLCYMEGTMGSI
jgi:hypothetical protein